MSAVESEEKQKVLLDAVKQLGHLYEEQSEYVTTSTLKRYLRARKGDVHAAAKLLKGTLKWRSNMKLETLSTGEFFDELSSGKMYVTGPDKDGHAILITRKKSEAFKPSGVEHFVRHLAFTMETCTKLMRQAGDKQEKIIWILDMNGYTRANSPPLSFSLATMRILADHYPERLGACFFVDAPAVFSWLWTAISPFLDPVTAKKVKFLKSADVAAVMNADHSTDGSESLKIKSDASDADIQQATARPVAIKNPAVADFLPYAPYHFKPYSEQEFGSLLKGVGWP